MEWTRSPCLGRLQGRLLILKKGWSWSGWDWKWQSGQLGSTHHSSCCMLTIKTSTSWFPRTLPSLNKHSPHIRHMIMIITYSVHFLFLCKVGNWSGLILRVLPSPTHPHFTEKIRRIVFACFPYNFVVILKFKFSLLRRFYPMLLGP